MLRRFYTFLESLLSPPPGSPGNPEVLEPGEPLRSMRFPRFRLILVLLMLMILISLPALLAVSGALWLARVGMESGNLLAWVVLFFFAPFVFLMGSLAFMADTALLAGILALIRGKPMIQIRFGQTTPWGKYQNVRDVHPLDADQLEARIPESSDQTPPDFR